MKLGEYIDAFSHNNMIRLLYKNEHGYETVLDSWDDVSMDWEVNKAKGINRHYINNEVIGIIGISGIKKNSDAINIIIEKIDNQPFIEELIEESNTSESLFKCTRYYWVDDKWIQPPVRIKHGDLVDIKCENYPIMLGRYIGKGYGVVELYNYSTGVEHVIGKVVSRGIDNNPRLVSDEILFDFIKE